MKITVNGKKHNLGVARGLTSCMIGFEKACELAGIPADRADRATCRQKDGTIIDLVPDMKCVAYDGSSFSVSLADASNTLIADAKNEEK